MKHRTRVHVALAIATTCLGLGFSSEPRAEEWPNKPIRIIVPFGAGGTTDVVMRILASGLSARWNVPVVIDNRTGAGGNIGSEIAARSAPDGYTMLAGVTATHGINPSLYAKLPYDPIKDFEPVSLIASTPSVFAVNTRLPVSTLPQLIAYAKARPGELHFGSPGNGATHHLAGELFNSLAGTKMVHVPYRTTAAAITDTIGGQIQIIIDTLPSAMTFVRGGKLKLLAVTGSQRDPSLPEVPTVIESGVPGYEVTGWYGLLFPAGTPAAIVKKASVDIAQVVASPEIRAKLLAQGAAPVGSTPAQFAEHIKREIGKWAGVVKASGAKVD
ncbi:tripartite tricarboxylate transporter substrate binding protein [Diaphorobacter sp. HDW4A]|uniref:Bug family tripartite tricarboxylate transporter substrate binding protein n=1 Tax=Diaphorobacter sp. HDW4A TaxID=2714924 RepID=UPI00140B6E0E|nr:tripartite tricarboxylate transporter substrate binding protein [Diaphorobacter sp. HDW4A]QIL79293.1 tripartite tricarboxylate transporter substrate binding protein [Diaphorobacter sp. HDW4A]